MTPRTPLKVGTRTVPEGLTATAARLPNKLAIAERNTGGDGWRGKTFSELKRDVDGLAQWLIDCGAGPDTPVLIVSGNSVAHAAMRYAAMSVGAPITPVSENYALLGAKGGYERLKYVVSLIRPRFIFAETAVFAGAVEAVAPSEAVILSREPDAMAGAASYETAIATKPTETVAARVAALDPDAPAAYMLTSGSTGKPKAVIQTQRMICANLYQGWMTLGRAAGWDDVLLEWLPWSHVSGAFSSMAGALFGGTFYIDGGKPAPGRFEETLRNLREIPLRYFTNVPSGYAMLADALEQDAELRRVFFSKLRLALYGGAGLPQALYDRFQRLAIETVGKRIFFTTGYGATETTSGCMSIYFDTEEVGIGLPMPGLSLKLTPIGERYEIRLKGPVITPGYLGREDLRDHMFDEEGYYRIGDAAVFCDPDRPERGLKFAGRLAEEFKLDNGTWVSAGALRAALLETLAPHVVDVLVCGENRFGVGVLAWRSPAAQAEPVEALAERLAAFNANNPGASMRVRRFAFLDEPPNAEAHEISDKGAVNQALAKRRRAADIERLYQTPPPAGVFAFD